MSKSISRRDFLKGSAASALGLAAASMLSGCANENQECPTQEKVECEATNGKDWLGVEPTIADSEIAQTIDCEVLVVGCGNAGNFAACSAAENGAKTICIDQWSELASSGIRDTLAAIGTKQQIANNDVPDKQKVIQLLQQQSNGYGSYDLHKLWADNSGEALDWYIDLLAKSGVHVLHEVDDHTLEHNYPMFDVGHSVQWEDHEYSSQFTMKYVVEYGKSIGVDYQWNKKMIKLVKEGEKVVGIIAQDTETDK